MPRTPFRTENESQDHTHNYMDSWFAEASGNYRINELVYGQNAGSDLDNRRFADWDVSAAQNQRHTHAISGGDRETRPVNAAVHWIIRAVD